VPERRSLVYLDTSVWLKSVMGEQGHEQSDEVIVAAAEGLIDVVASWLVRAEIQSAAAGAVSQEIRDALGALLDRGGVRWVALDRFVATDAVQLSKSLPKRLAGADAVHLATAVREGCRYFMAYDRKYPYGEDVKGVTVMQPAVVWDPQLPYGGS
jgi:predicted nucleic acid-binding protein